MADAVSRAFTMLMATGLSATAPTCSQVNISWNAATDSGSGIKGYNVYRNGAYWKQVLAPATVSGPAMRSRWTARA